MIAVAAVVTVAAIVTVTVTVAVEGLANVSLRNLARLLRYYRQQRQRQI